jgi:hypothetical protein
VSRCPAEKALRQPSRGLSPHSLRSYLSLTFLRSVVAGSTLLQLSLSANLVSCSETLTLHSLPAKGCANQNILSSELSGLDTTSVHSRGLRIQLNPDHPDHPGRARSSSSSHALIRLSSGCASRLLSRGEERLELYTPTSQHATVLKPYQPSVAKYVWHAAGYLGARLQIAL